MPCQEVQTDGYISGSSRFGYKAFYSLKCVDDVSRAPELRRTNRTMAEGYTPNQTKGLTGRKSIKNQSDYTLFVQTCIRTRTFFLFFIFSEIVILSDTTPHRRWQASIIPGAAPESTVALELGPKLPSVARAFRRTPGRRTFTALNKFSASKMKLR